MNIGVIGLGLIGGSVARAASRAGWTVYASDVDPDSLRQAQDDGVIEAETEWTRWIQHVEQVVVAVPIGYVAEWILRVAAAAGGAPLVIVDVSSVKAPLADVFGQVSPPVDVLSLHPMAGREVRGYAHSRADLFSGHPCAVIRSGDKAPDPGVVDRWMALLGTAPRIMTIEEHDRVVGVVSHLPYLASAALLDTVARRHRDVPGWAKMAGSGFLDTTRIGASDPGLWREILSANREAVVEAFDEYARVVREWADALAEGRWPEGLDGAAAVRRRIRKERE